MATDTIDLALSNSSFPATYVGPGTLIGNAYYSPDCDIATGYFTTDGNPVAIPLGFVPQSVEVVDVTDVTKWTWMRGMPATDALKEVTGGAMTVDTTSAVVVTTNTANGTATVTLSATDFPTGKLVIFKVLG
jgi:hypothetical protein